MDRYYLVKLLTNTAGQDGSSVSVYTTYDGAIVAYHQTLAAFHNADDVLFAVVSLNDGQGNPKLKEIVNHIPEPEPEEEE